MKTKKVLTIIGVAAAIVVILFFVLSLFLRDNNAEAKPVKKYGSPLDYFELVSSNENGGEYFEAEVSAGDNGTVYLKTVRRDTPDFPEQQQEYTAEAELLGKIEELFYSKNIGAWAERKNHEIFGYDAADYKLKFRFGSDELFIDSAKIPDSGYASVKELTALIYSYKKNENSEITLAESTETAEKKPLEILPYDIENGYFIAAIRNNGGEDVSFETSFKAYILSGEEYTELKAAKEITPQSFTVPNGAEITVQLDMNAFGKLEKGRYKITCSGAECEFTLE